MSRYRITVRGQGIELRGFLDGDEQDLGRLAEVMTDFGLVIASPAEPDYNPFEQTDWPRVARDLRSELTTVDTIRESFAKARQVGEASFDRREQAGE